MYSPQQLRGMNERICKQIEGDRAAKEARLERAKSRPPSVYAQTGEMPRGFVSGWRPKSG